MLDHETKRRIDAARDTLVGKVPDPKSQVEQITIALIYKFMADMDNQAESVGGKRSFFAGDFEPYRWENLMSPGMGGHEVLNHYAEAIARMNENPGIPQLFRDIFKNANLPYRDPETLRGFLKIINDFQYDHSERLGDAYEYLLSVLDSQGDAGQFRTPRHIIDFMVDIVAPKKDEVILDPACGTAGFLISSWKHIWNANAKDGKPGTALTPDERRKLARNIFGYDISPDYVRLSLVNMYLHDFAEPHIYEYDTLTSEERWNEHADVILANPPFMTPKGGIRPHRRFSIQVTRSEVLFVDYIAASRNDTAVFRSIVSGLARGAREARVPIVGGETAIMPDLFRAGAFTFDLAGTVVGTIPPGRAVTGRAIRRGDAIIGARSSGLHSNGYSLARRALAGMPLGERVPRGRSLGEELLRPTRIYATAALDAMSRFDVHGMAHITGGAFSNLLRLKRASYEIDSLPRTPPIMELIRSRGVADAEMYRTFNMGVGLCVIADEADARGIVAAMRRHGIASQVIGHVGAGAGVRVSGLKVA